MKSSSTDDQSLRLYTVGSSDAFNSGGRGNSCFWVEDDRGAYLLDCGPTTTRGLKLAHHLNHIQLEELECIYLTHVHGDHFGGIPVLLLELNFGLQRTKPLCIAGPVGTEQRVRQLCEIMYQGMFKLLNSFDVQFIEWPLESSAIVCGRPLKSISANHDPTAAPTSIRIGEQQKSITFSGDTGWNEKLVELSANSRALVLECSYAHHSFAGHLSLDEITSQRNRFNVDRLILTHFSELSRSAAVAHQASFRLEVADDGAEWCW